MARGVVRSAAVEVAPLSHRVAAMHLFRLAVIGVLTLLAVMHSSVQPTDVTIGGVYLALTMALSSLVLTPRSALAVKAFGVSLLIDGAFLQYAHERLGQGAGVDAVIAAQLVAACLLASFRTGLKLAVWQSLLMVVAWRGEESGLFPQPDAMAGVARDTMVTTDMALIWLVVLTTSVAASINERELRRRRYDAEALGRLAAALLTDDRSAAVADRLLRFVTSELGVQRAVVVARGLDGLSEDAGLRVLAGVGLNPGAPTSGGHASAYLDLVNASPEPVLTRRLDQRRDPVLDDVLPGARRLAAVGLGDPRLGGEPLFLVMEFGSAGRGSRVERRMVTSATQAAATAALALSRSELMEDARRAAVTDGLTGLANRRSFDQMMAGAERGWREHGVPFALILVDVDHFKSVNDRFGHQVGDQVLITVGRVLDALATGAATVARYGGEEFAVVLPGADTAVAAGMAGRMRTLVAEIDRPVLVTASFGVAGVPEDAAGADSVIKVADAALLQAKALGRDRVVVAEPSTSAGV
jgi:two-component system cell cycle response regulator